MHVLSQKHIDQLLASKMMVLKTVVVVITLICLAASSKGLSRVLVSPEDTVADAGDRLFLPCVAFTTVSNTDNPSSANPSLLWKRGEQVLENSSRIIIHHEAVSTLAGSNGGTIVKSVLEVCGAEREDHGVYSCSISGGTAGQEEPTDMASFKLHVLTAPATVLVTSNATNEESSTNATLFLSIAGFGLPVPEVTWQRNGRDVSNSVPPHMTEIRNDVIPLGGQKFIRSTLILALCDVMANRELIGEYTAVVQNDMGTSQFTFNVTAPTPVAIKSGPPLSNTVKVGESRSLTCDVYGYPWPSITWTRNTSSSPIATRGRFSVDTHQVISGGYQFTRSVLNIHTALESIEGTFSCSASNGDNVPKNITFTIDVIVPPQIVVEPAYLTNMVANATVQQTLVVTCVALGSPLPTIQWKNLTSGREPENVIVNETVKSHGGIEFVHSRLELCGVERQPNTNYSCKALTVDKTSDASNSSRFEICTIGEIEMMVAPSDQRVDKGDGVFLPCVVLSQQTDESTKVVWRRRRAMEGENSIEELKNATKKVAIFQRRERRGDGYILIRSILYLGCISEEDAGMYSCHAANTNVTKMANFMIEIPVPEPEEGELGDGPQLNHAGYIGPLATNILLLTVITIYLVFRELRVSSTGVPLINLCSSLIALNFSYIASLVSANRSGTGGSGCGFLAALFHYLLLVGSFAFVVMVTFVLTKWKKWSRKATIIFYVITFVANWGLPVIIVSISAASDVSNYSSELTTFCGPVSWALYLGVAFPVIVVHLVTLIMLLILTFLSKKVQNNVKQREMLGISVTLILFDLIWGVGLSSFIVPQESSAQMTLQNVFIIASAVHGLLIVSFFCVLSKKVREKLFWWRSKSSDQERESSGTAEEGLTPGSNFTNLDSSINSETVFIPHRKMSTGSVGCPASPGVESVQNYPVHFKIASLDPIPEHQSDC